MDVVTRVKVKAIADGAAAAPFDIAPRDGDQRSEGRRRARRGAAARIAARQPDARRQQSVSRDARRAAARGREYEFEFHHSGKVIHDAGDHVFYISARANWYPAFGLDSPITTCSSAIRAISTW